MTRKGTLLVSVGFRRRWFSVVALMTVAVGVSTSIGSGPAFAQAPLPNDMVSIDPAVIGRQVRAAITLGEQARASLAASTSDDITAPHKLLDTMYRQVRLALGNLRDLKSRTKMVDPVMELEITKIAFAWNTIRRPVDSFYNSPVISEWKVSAAHDLQISMATLRQVEVLLP